MNDEITSRKFTKDDESFIYSSWLRSYWDLEASHHHMTKKTFFDNHPRLIEKKIKTGEMIVVCSKLDENVILGYLIGEIHLGIPVIHYIYVKEAFRNEKLATEMVNNFVKDAPHIVVTHMTESKSFQHMFKKYNWQFVPYLF